MAALQRLAEGAVKADGFFSHSREDWEHLMDLSKRGRYDCTDPPMVYIQAWANEAGFELLVQGDTITVRDPKFTPKPKFPVPIVRCLFEDL